MVHKVEERWRELRDTVHQARLVSFALEKYNEADVKFEQAKSVKKLELSELNRYVDEFNKTHENVAKMSLTSSQGYMESDVEFYT